MTFNHNYSLRNIVIYSCLYGTYMHYVHSKNWLPSTHRIRWSRINKWIFFNQSIHSSIEICW